MDFTVDSLFDRYDRGKMTRRQLVQSLAAAFAMPAGVLAQDAGPAAAPIVRGLTVNHANLTVADIPRSRAFYERLFGVTKGWPTANPATSIHMALPEGYISLDSAAEKKGVIDHFAVGIDNVDADSAKRLVATINNEMPDAKATGSFNGTVWSIFLRDPDCVRVQISRRDGR
jgi:catechol 2,3-dioxygenase-like lactoylglutathione lyase family enzyme